jgi:hypothetical protein
MRKRPSRKRGLCQAPSHALMQDTPMGPEQPCIVVYGIQTDYDQDIVMEVLVQGEAAMQNQGIPPVVHVTSQIMTVDVDFVMFEVLSTSPSAQTPIDQSDTAAHMEIYGELLQHLPYTVED